MRTKCVTCCVSLLYKPRSLLCLLDLSVVRPGNGQGSGGRRAKTATEDRHSARQASKNPTPVSQLLLTLCMLQQASARTCPLFMYVESNEYFIFTQQNVWSALARTDERRNAYFAEEARKTRLQLVRARKDLRELWLERDELAMLAGQAIQVRGLPRATQPFSAAQDKYFLQHIHK